MNIDPNDFWNLLATSQLVSHDRLVTVRSQVKTDLNFDKGQQPDADTIANSLVESQVITKFQAEILLAGRTGPFRFGDYSIVDRFLQGPLIGSFSAIHRPSQHPVILEFVSGSDESALILWKRLRQKADFLLKTDNRNLTRVYETVSLPDYRLIVSQINRGTALSSKLPRKSRLPWKDACLIAAHLANGLSELHQSGATHGSISPRTVWMAAKSPAVLRHSFLPDTNFSKPKSSKSESELDYRAPEFTDSSDSTTHTDMYSLGCLLHRMIRGHAPFAEYPVEKKRAAHQSKPQANLDKYELPRKLQLILDSLLDKSPPARPDAATTFQKLAELSEKSEKSIAMAPPVQPTESQFLKQIRTSSPIIGEQKMLEDQAPKIVLPDGAQPQAAMETEFTPTNTKVPIAKRKKSSSTVLILVASIASLAGIVGLGAWWAMNIDFAAPKVITQNDEEPTDPDKTDSDDGELVTEGQGGRLVQVLVSDDGSELWETPTVGPPVDFAHLPTGVQIAFAIRPNLLLADPEGVRILRGLGPGLEDSTQWLNTATGLSLSEIDQLLIGYCTTDQITYTACYVIRLTEPMPREQLVQLWRPQVAARDSETGVYENEQGFGYFVTTDPDNPELATSFAMGPASQMKIVSELAGANPLSSVLSTLASKTDSHRHFNCLFLPNALFNDEGQALMAGSLEKVQRYLRVALPEGLRGALVSLHLDNGTYLESYVEHSSEVKPSDMATQLDQLVRNVRDDVTTSLGDSQPNPYWDRLRTRFGIMVNDFYRNTRVGVEGSDVLANCWLPETAAHNLVAGSEIALNFATGNVGPVTKTAKVPKTLTELLNTKRDLSIATNPDLGLLLGGIKTSILDDYGNLPFEFDIKLMGNDLLKDGITQNQRPGDFELKQKTLAEILTEIMYRANPDKGATGPSDPACKLIWVVAEEPEGSGKRIVLITTRDAATTKGYELPSAFVVPE